MILPKIGLATQARMRPGCVRLSPSAREQVPSIVLALMLCTQAGAEDFKTELSRLRAMQRECELRINDRPEFAELVRRFKARRTRIYQILESQREYQEARRYEKRLAHPP